MKKFNFILLIVISLLLITGCEAYYVDGIKIYELKITNPNNDGTTYLEGSIRNTNEYDCGKTTLTLELTKDSDIKTDNIVIVDAVRKGYIYTVKQPLQTNYEGYKVTVKKATCEKLDNSTTTDNTNNDITENNDTTINNNDNTNGNNTEDDDAKELEDIINGNLD